MGVELHLKNDQTIRGEIKSCSNWGFELEDGRAVNYMVIDSVSGFDKATMNHLMDVIPSLNVMIENDAYSATFGGVTLPKLEIQSRSIFKRFSCNIWSPVYPISSIDVELSSEFAFSSPYYFTLRYSFGQFADETSHNLGSFVMGLGRHYHIFKSTLNFDLQFGRAFITYDYREGGIDANLGVSASGIEYQYAGLASFSMTNSRPLFKGKMTGNYGIRLNSTKLKTNSKDYDAAVIVGLSILFPNSD